MTISLICHSTLAEMDAGDVVEWHEALRSDDDGRLLQRRPADNENTLKLSDKRQKSLTKYIGEHFLPFLTQLELQLVLKWPSSDKGTGQPATTSALSTPEANS